MDLFHLRRQIDMQPGNLRNLGRKRRVHLERQPSASLMAHHDRRFGFDAKSHEHSPVPWPHSPRLDT